ncbi:phosphatidylethanolamine-binding protein 4 isoform X2 [Conger conger]|uniref:phosphatidylethanolamine-binding protein 4 isoform X2 n=1 Tax=Conger conger TaxID=82655 RepID=UPI002A5A7B21|nr:phosphatidylethanolamine-binding protein 4 isoform X2 [Conger conger]
MKRLHIFLLCATVSLCKTQEVCGGECGAETLSEHDAGFCHGGLEVIYPELKISICSIVPRGQSLRDKISREWGPPRVRLTRIEKGKRYVLMMVDPDAPSRCSPTRAHWRHWLVADIAPQPRRGGDTGEPALRTARAGLLTQAVPFHPEAALLDTHPLNCLKCAISYTLREETLMRY